MLFNYPKPTGTQTATTTHEFVTKDTLDKMYNNNNNSHILIIQVSVSMQFETATHTHSVN